MITANTISRLASFRLGCPRRAGGKGRQDRGSDRPV